MEFVILILLLVNLVLIAVLLWRSFRQDDGTDLRRDLIELNQKAAAEQQRGMVQSMGVMGRSITGNIRSMSDTLGDNLRTMQDALNQTQRLTAETQNARLETIDRHVIARQEAMNQAVEQEMKAMEQRLVRLEERMTQSMGEMRKENAQKLDEIRGTVDEKLQDALQKKIAESFQSVSQQLEQVYKGLGEMQHLASDVGGLKQVLSGVKTRGILGELQLGAILEEILSPEQYDTNVATIPGSRERVEFAVKLPGSDGGHVYLPIDSKFPGDTYMHLQDAQTSGDPAALAQARQKLTAALRKCAKDIRDKYVEPPYTTTFGILFLPFEGLYADVVNQGLIEVLQREYNINIAGPSTMAALLNSLQMGFRTLAIQKRSNEVWRVLGEIKTEFSKFEDSMVKMQTHLRQTSEDLEHLMGTRTRAINRKLRSVQELDPPKNQLLNEEE